MKSLQLITTLIAKPGKEEKVSSLIVELVGPTRSEPGCWRYRPYASMKKGHFIIDEMWESAEALKLHLASGHFNRASAEFPELLAAEPEMDFVSGLG